MTKKESKKREAINWIKEYLIREFGRGNNPPDNIYEWQQKFFTDRLYHEVYQILHDAGNEVEEESKGRIWFCHNILEDKWRFHEGRDDYLAIHYGTGQRIAGHLRRQSVNWGFSSILAPEIKEEVHFIDTPILTVEKKIILEVRKDYIPSLN